MEIKTIKKEEIEKIIDLKNISVYNLCNGVIEMSIIFVPISV